MKKEKGSLLETLLSSLVSGWIQSQQVRYDSAELSASAFQNKKGLFEGHVTQFIRFKRLTYVFCISVDGWSDNRYWRWMHGWKFTKAT